MVVVAAEAELSDGRQHAAWKRRQACSLPPLCCTLWSMQAAVRAVRNARAEYGVEPARKIAATVR